MKNPVKQILGTAKDIEILGFNDTTFFFLGCFVNTSIMMSILHLDMFLIGPLDRFIGTWLLIFLYMCLHWYLLRYFYLILLKSFPGYDNRIKRIFRLPLLWIIYFLVSFGLDFFWEAILKAQDPSQQPSPFSKGLVIGLAMMTTIIVIYEALHLFVELKNIKITQTKLEKEQLNAQLVHLKNQISPHFLFNSLNTLVYLIDEDTEKGKEFAHKLSFIYQSILETSDKKLVSLMEEMEYTKAYSDLLGQRFGDNLIFNFQVDKGVQHKKIIPMALQVGIENAVKHNIISKQKPLTIDIISQNAFLIVKNNHQKKVNGVSKKGFGLKNISNRYELLTNMRVEIQHNQHHFILKLPLIGI